MPSQVSLLQRKVFVHSANIIWYSEPMYWGGYERCEMILACYGLNQSADSPAVGIIFQGSNEPGYNAIWTNISAGTPSDPVALSATGVNRYIRDGTLYPYVRIQLQMNAASGIRMCDVSLEGSLFEQSAQ